ncbi:MAG TPA: hypothetical protein VNN07_01400 [Candidatus Tectomicrobia bacterium]|nr:hypothetical protein [Candidatus Tectomicrobia bacterium]
MGNASALAGLMLLFGVATTNPAAAQDATVDGAYERLSPGNQKIARALWEAQQPSSTPSNGTGTTTTTARQPLTLDEIAARKQSGQGWGQVFKSMKAQGLVQEKNLGQVVSKYSRSQYSGAGVVTTAGNATVSTGTHRNGKGAGGDDEGGTSVAQGPGNGHGHARYSSASTSGGTHVTRAHGNGHAHGRANQAHAKTK